MSYIGNRPATGENNSFRILDDITSYTLTFDGSSSSVVSIADDTIRSIDHRFVQGQRVTYNDGGGTAIGGLSDGVYFIIKNDQDTIKLAASASDAANLIPVSLSGLGAGSSHTLNVAFDGINTKFTASYGDGIKGKVTRAAQLQISINGVIQQPQDTTSPSTGFGIDGSIIIFSVAPIVTDVFWGNLVANNFPTFDISDNDVDTFTGDNSTVSFTLSKDPKDARNVLVTLDGVVQYPSSPGITKAYDVSENVLTFTAAPALGVDISVRHIGFAGPSLSGSSDAGSIGIQSGGVTIDTDATTLNFIGLGNTFAVNGRTVDISIQGGNTGAGGTWAANNVGVYTGKSVGINTTDVVGTASSEGALQVNGNVAIIDGALLTNKNIYGEIFVPNDKNALLIGPVTVGAAATIDVAVGSVLVIV